MDLSLTIATAALATAFGAALALAARRSLAPRARLRFARLVERVGVGPASLGQPGVLWEISQATRICARCPSVVRCQAWLDASHRRGFEEFCPNAALVRRIALAQTRCSFRL